MSYLQGRAMTGGYGGGSDILHACTIAVDKGEIAVIVGPNGVVIAEAGETQEELLTFDIDEKKLDWLWGNI